MPAREFAAVEPASDPGKLAVVGDGCSSSSSWALLSDERVLRPSLTVEGGAGAGRERDAGAGAGVDGFSGSSPAFSCLDEGCGEPAPPRLTWLTGNSVLVTLRACWRCRRLGSFGSSLPTLVAKTRAGAPDLVPFFELRLGKRGESTTAGIS